jgi:acyl-coenzyme A synthetase/AMP-(fatty) acid ligase
LERNARTRPDDIFAVFEGGERWTFAQTPQQVASLAGNLHELGVRQGDHVVLVLPTSPLALRVMFAINYLGAVYVPVNPALKGRRSSTSCITPAPHSPSSMIVFSIAFLPPRPCPSARRRRSPACR